MMLGTTNIKKKIKKMRVSLKFDKNNGYFTRRPMYMIMSC